MVSKSYIYTVSGPSRAHSFEVLWPRLVALLGLVLVVGSAFAGCSASAATGAVSYSVSAQKNYQKGLEEIKEEDWIAAIKYFAFIKARFPYSKYAVLAELRMADTEFGAGRYLQAIDGYKLFIKFHPTHDMVTNGYASFRIGEAYYKMLPSDLWIVPPSYEKDQSATYDAERELRRFVQRFPGSSYIDKAKEMVLQVSERLARHEWYVANFYWERNQPMGAVLRLRRLLDRYPGAGFDGDALWLLGRAYMAVDMPDRAKQAWQRLIEEHPQHQRVGEARDALVRLPG